MHVVVSKKLIFPECLEILKCSRKCLKDTGSGLGAINKLYDFVSTPARLNVCYLYTRNMSS